ncbi:MAG: NTP transferase domain-containing protein [Anaerohalosphaera sp.]|nr:NTP transferase domain-containing protein [Anaerohalosphaera sp.]
MSERVAIVMAAGQSTRMNTKLPKVLHEVCGRPMLEYVLDACRTAGVQKVIVVVGYGKDQIMARYADDSDVVFVEQKEQLGTGHAVMCCREHLEGLKGQVLILCGDAPLIRSETLKTLINKHEQEKSRATLATTVMDDPSGYGRIERDSYGNIQGIVEHNDCSEKQLAIQEINPGYFYFDVPILLEALKKITPNNVKNEYYLTDALHITIAEGHKVTAVTAVAPEDAMGVNNRFQLSQASKIMQQRIQERLMENGVTIVDPPNTWIDARAEIGQDTVIEPFTYIHGQVKVGRDCRIGPFAYLREDATLGSDVVLGVFTEIKSSTLGDGVRARHHSYIGNADVRENVNIGAGTITANFDGKNIHHTTIGKDSFVGSGAVLIAPLEISDNSHIKPGTVLLQEDIDSVVGKEAK